MAVQFALPSAYALDSNGAPIVGARIYFKVPATSTAKDVYSDSTLSTPVEQPIVADAAGRFDRVYMGSGNYKIIFCGTGSTESDNVIETWDNYDPGLPQGFGTSDAVPVSLGGTGAANAPLALQNLNAASQDQITDIQSDISALQATDATLGALAILDTINDAALIDTSVKTVLNPFGLQFAHFRDVQTSGTAGASYSSGAWRQIRLNTATTNQLSGAALSSNQITGLVAGTYYVRAFCPYSSGDASMLVQGRIYDITGSASLLLGTNQGKGGTQGFGNGMIFVEGLFTLGATKTIEFELQSNSNLTGGLASSLGNEIYAQLFLWKVA